MVKSLNSDFKQALGIVKKNDPSGLEADDKHTEHSLATFASKKNQKEEVVNTELEEDQ
jgi:hypothetical protein